jgi:hypothetical protein
MLEANHGKTSSLDNPGPRGRLRAPVVTRTVTELRRTTLLWSSVTRIRDLVAPPLCALVHAAVESLGPDRLRHDVVLKHAYDYQAIELDTALLGRSLHTGEWARLSASQNVNWLERRQIWLRLGGGWKNVQRHLSRNVHGQFIAAGDWDRAQKPFVMRQTVVDLFVKGLDPEQTTEYQKMRAWVAAGEFAWTRGCRTIEDVDAYFAELLALYDSIRTEGYRSQVELGNVAADEIRVAIDRDGRPCVFGGGTHRLSIARLLELRRVPVVIKRVHPQWVEHCRARYATESVHLAIARGIADLAKPSEDDEPTRSRRMTP